MTTLVDRLLIKMRLLPQPASSAAVSFAAGAGAKRIEDLSNIPRYPPFMEGLPVHSPAALLGTQKELTSGVQQLIANRELLEAYYEPAMLRLAELVQLLPASQSHHHRGAGGMLRHSLEVGLWTLQQTEGKLIRGVITPQKRRVIEPRWRLAAFLAGICHDLGKLVTDFTVTDRAGGLKWRPYMQGLHQWADQNKVENYFMHWVDGRGKNHTNVSSTLIESVVSRKTLDWIGEGSTDVMIWLTESLNNNPGSGNQIHNFVVKADQLSVERDLKSMGAAMAGYEIGVPIERYLADIMRRLVQEGLWRINEPGARVWNIDNTTYLIWPMAGEEIASRTRAEDIAGLPKTGDGILDMLVERDMAFLREDSGDDPFFYIAPDVVTEKIPDMRLRAIRLRDQALISSMPIAAITGKIYASRVDPKIKAVEKTEQVGMIANTDATSQSVCSTSAEHLEACKNAEPPQSVHGTSVEHLENGKKSQSIHGTSAEHLPDLPAEVSNSKSICGTPAERVKKPAISLESLDGAVGEVIRVLAAEFKSGQKSFAEFGSKQSDGGVCLKWPATFASYGLTGKEILGYLSDNGWLIPASDIAKIGDAQFADGVAKALHLTSDIGKLIVAGKPATQKKPKPAAQSAPGPDLPAAPALPAPVLAEAAPVVPLQSPAPVEDSFAAGMSAAAQKKARKPVRPKAGAAVTAVQEKPEVPAIKAVPDKCKRTSVLARLIARQEKKNKGEAIEEKTY